MKPNARVWAVLTVVALAILLRVDWHLAFSGLPIYDSPAVDEALHWSWAQDLAAGRGSPEIPYFRAPLYPWWLGALKWTGLEITGLRWAGTVLGLINLILLAWLAKRWLGRRTGLVLLLLIGCSATWIYYEPQLLIEPFLLSWLICATCCWLLLQERPPGLADLGFGLSLGLAAIARPNALLLAPLALLLVLTLKERPARRLVRSGWWSTGWLAPVVLVAWINGWPGSGVLLASQGGVNFWIGNHPGADGTSASMPESGHAWERADAAELAAREAGHALGPATESEFYFDRAFQWMRHEPGAAVVLMLRKTALLLAPFELGNNTSPQIVAARRPWMRWLLPISWWLVLLPGLAGLALGYPRHPGLRRWVTGALLLYGASIVLFFVNGRFRLALIPFLALPAADLLAHALPAGWRRLRAQGLDAAIKLEDRKPVPTWRIGLALSLVAAALASWLVLKPEHDDTWRRGQAGWQAFQLGNAWMRLGEADSARVAFREARREAPRLPEVCLNLGLLELPTRPAVAESLFREELNVDPRSAKALNNLGSLLLRSGRAAPAAEAFAAALRLRPGLEDAAWNLGLAMATLGLDAAARGDTVFAREALARVLETPYRGRGLTLLSTKLSRPAARP